MSLQPNKPLVLIVGGSGNTGLSIAKGLAKSGGWRIAVAVRATSVAKPEVAFLKELGAEIKVSDFQSASPDELDELCKGADTVISTCYLTPDVLLAQTRLVDAAKRIGVKRFIPCDRISVPYKLGSTSIMASLIRSFYGDGETKNAIINREHIGDFVARIIADLRTLNQYVFACEVEVSQKEIYEFCSRVAGEDFRQIHESVSLEELEERAKNTEGIHRIWLQYQYSMWGRGDNCSEVAKSLGALDAQELYPDMKHQTLEEFVETFYSEVN